jgi:cytochrome P450
VPVRGRAQNRLMRSLDEAPFLDLFDPGFQADPAATIAELRRQSPVIRTTVGALVVDRANVHGLLLDRSLRSSLLHFVRLQGVTEGPIYEMTASSLLALDGEDHARIRRVVSRSFTPLAAEGHRPFMRELATELVDGFASTGRCEFMSDFADRYPVQVIAHLLGVPREDHPLFARWGDSLTHLLSLELSLYLADIESAQAELAGYLERLVADRRSRPRDDLVSELIAASDGRDRLSDEELLALLGALLFAGYDTTRNQLAVAMTIFSAYPEEWERLADRPETASDAVEELMRAAGVVGVVPRLTTRDLDVSGWWIPADTLLSLSLAGANHDPDVYDDPDRFNPSARRRAGHVGFGGGPHHCLGASLARAEMQEALPILARNMRGMKVVGEPEWRSPLGGIAGPLELHLRFSPAAAPASR